MIFVGIYVMIWGIIERNIIMILVGLISACLFSDQIIRAIYIRIIFYDDYIHAVGDLLPKAAKIQFEDKIEYSQIASVRVISSSKNSRKEYIEARANNSNTPKTYFEFALKNGKTSWIFIFYYSKKQRKEMIDIINQKTGLNLNYDEMIKNRQSV